MPTWLQHLRDILEILYFVAGIVIACTAVYGLKQLTITREVARNNARREAVKFAAERCQYFADFVAVGSKELSQVYQDRRLTFLGSNVGTWHVHNGEITTDNYDLSLLKTEYPQIRSQLSAYMNRYEAFAIPFAEGVADDDVGYQETAIAYCQNIKFLLPAFFQMRREGSARYESSIRLYERWNKRLTVEAIAPGSKSVEDVRKSMEKEKTKPIGT